MTDLSNTPEPTPDGNQPDRLPAPLFLASERDRLVTHPLFRRSPNLARLLDYLVNFTINHPGQTPKAYMIAVDALGRSDDFDPAINSYPRVQARRLRALMDDYYTQVPSARRLLIRPGGYAVEIAESPGALKQVDAGNRHVISDATHIALPHRDPEQAGRVTAKIGTLLPIMGVAIALLMLVVALTLPNLRAAAQPAAVFTVHLSTDAADSGNEQSLHLVRDRLVDHLSRFDMVTLAGSETANRASARAGHYRLAISVAGLPHQQAALLTLQPGHSGNPVWSHTLLLGDDADDNNRQIMSAASALAADYGVLTRHHLADNPGSMAPGLDCLTHVAEFRHMRDRSVLPQLETCLTDSLARFPEHRPLYLDALSFTLYTMAETSADSAGDSRRAAAAAAEAYDSAGRDSALAAFARARAAFHAGDCATGVNLANAAYHLNPADGERTAMIGAFLLLCHSPDAERVLNMAVDVDGDRASHALMLLAYLSAERGDGAETLRLINRTAPLGPQEQHFLMLRAFAQHDLGNAAAARAVWQQLSREIGAAPGMSAEAFLRRFMSNRRTVAGIAPMIRSRGLQG